MTDESFQAHARRAGKAWQSELHLLVLPFAILALIIGTATWDTSTREVLFWSILLLLLGFGSLTWSYWLFFVWRPKCLSCPDCHTKGRFVRVGPKYFFQCDLCEKFADCGVTADPGESHFNG